MDGGRFDFIWTEEKTEISVNHQGMAFDAEHLKLAIQQLLGLALKFQPPIGEHVAALIGVEHRPVLAAKRLKRATRPGLMVGFTEWPRVKIGVTFGYWY
jgi:hypothetical protein